MASFNRAVVNYTVANSKSFPFLGAVQDEDREGEMSVCNKSEEDQISFYASTMCEQKIGNNLCECSSPPTFRF
jgi:hypothetical protein